MKKNRMIEIVKDRHKTDGQKGKQRKIASRKTKKRENFSTPTLLEFVKGADSAWLQKNQHS